MCHTEERGQQTAVETLEAFGCPDVLGAVGNGLVGAGSVLARGEHASLDDPDRVRCNPSEDS